MIHIKVRWIIRDGQKILQERVEWESYENVEYFWQDVPIQDERNDTGLAEEK